MRPVDPFETWHRAIILDSNQQIADSRKQFHFAANLFFELANKNPGLSRPSFEYSTLMDAFSNVQLARELEKKQDFDLSLNSFTKAAEILRASVHFGFLSGYVTACAIIESIYDLDTASDQIDAMKNAIGLLEQSKLALGFRDEKHPILNSIDSVIRICVNEARPMTRESSKLKEYETSNATESQGKDTSEPSEAQLDDAEALSKRSESKREKLLDYFPVRDWERATISGFVTTFLENGSVLIANVGVNPVRIETLGNYAKELIIQPKASLRHRIDSPPKGRIRIQYVDTITHSHYDEGCFLCV